MTGNLDDEQFGKIGCAVFILVMIVVLIFSWLFLAYYNRHHQCLKLNNGLNIGYEAVFDLSRHYWRPVVVPKFPDGRPLVRDDLWAIYPTDTTLYGRTTTPETGPYSAFAWRSDTGLILSHENVETYNRLVSEAGELNPYLGTGAIGPGVYFEKLKQRPEFDGQRCRTQFVTW